MRRGSTEAAARSGDGWHAANDGERVIKFVVLAAPRTGSNWVCSMLNSHPEILCHHEIFNPEGIHYALDHRRGDLNLGDLEERERAPLLFLSRLWQQTFGCRAVGFKLNRQQNREVFQSILINPQVRKLVLSRRNRIKTFVSEMLAEQTGQWESYETSRTSAGKRKVCIELKALLAHIALNQDYYAHIQESLETTGQTFLRVAYEDLKFEEEWMRILKFLEVSPIAWPLTPGTRKQNSTDLRDLISNFTELDAALAGSELHAEMHALEF